MPFLTQDRPTRRAAPWALLLAAAVLAAGCGTLDVPRADNYPATGQPKARAVHHWDVLAGDVAARVAQKIAGWPEGEHPIHVRVAESSAFEQGFGKLLAVQLLERGVALSQEPAAVELLVQTQVVQHQAGVRNGLAMPWTRLAAGVAVVRDWHRYAQSAASGVASGLALGMAVDMAEQHTQGAAAGGPTRTEVLVTTLLQAGGRYLAGSADVYYIEPEDAVLYLPPPPAVPLAPVKSWKVVTP
ncbi:MAG: hypothetical protein LC097_08565 [Burkholderiales bacterium]|uniref:hypothetical protein n=1 Tax=Comamonas granuli TaxID=290309 RepID=UPI0005A6755A|nr:hypothetical protein [Comamonas granuli]MCZ2406774.1 hypothetical protein [Burkholderiales bacterium]